MIILHLWEHQLTITQTQEKPSIIIPPKPANKKRKTIKHSQFRTEILEGPLSFTGSASRENHIADVLKKAAAHVSDKLPGSTRGVRSAVQLVNTLFDIAAAITSVAHTDNEDEKQTLKFLHEHANDGLELAAACLGGV